MEDQKKLEEKFFNKLAKILEKEFPKYEECQCGKRLPCRSRALVLNAYANIFFKELKQKWWEELKEFLCEECKKEYAKRNL